MQLDYSLEKRAFEPHNPNAWKPGYDSSEIDLQTDEDTEKLTCAIGGCIVLGRIASRGDLGTLLHLPGIANMPKAEPESESLAHYKVIVREVIAEYLRLHPAEKDGETIGVTGGPFSGTKDDLQELRWEYADVVSDPDSLDVRLTTESQMCPKYIELIHEILQCLLENRLEPFLYLSNRIKEVSLEREPRYFCVQSNFESHPHWSRSNHEVVFEKWIT